MSEEATALNAWLHTHGGALNEGDFDGIADFLESAWLARHDAKIRAEARRRMRAVLRARTYPGPV